MEVEIELQIAKFVIYLPTWLPGWLPLDHEWSQIDPEGWVPTFFNFISVKVWTGGVVLPFSICILFTFRSMKLDSILVVECVGHVWDIHHTCRYTSQLCSHNFESDIRSLILQWFGFTKQPTNLQITPLMTNICQGNLLLPLCKLIYCVLWAFIFIFCGNNYYESYTFLCNRSFRTKGNVVYWKPYPDLQTQ